MMKEVQNKCYQLIGEIAIALYGCGNSKHIKISFDSLKSIMKDHGFEYSGTENIGLGQAVKAAHNAFQKCNDEETRHAIAVTFTNKDGNWAWDVT